MNLEPKHKNLTGPLKIKATVLKRFNIRRHVSTLSGFWMLLLKIILNRWHSPFKRSRVAQHSVSQSAACCDCCVSSVFDSDPPKICLLDPDPQWILADSETLSARGVPRGDAQDARASPPSPVHPPSPQCASPPPQPERRNMRKDKANNGGGGGVGTPKMGIPPANT